MAQIFTRDEMIKSEEKVDWRKATHQQKQGYQVTSRRWLSQMTLLEEHIKCSSHMCNSQTHWHVITIIQLYTHKCRKRTHDL